VTRQRIYLETMERIFGNADKLVYDPGSGAGQGVLPYLPLGELSRRPPQQQPQQQQQGGSTR
jgi:membrane protease subunit HflK